MCHLQAGYRKKKELLVRSVLCDIAQGEVFQGGVVNCASCCFKVKMTEENWICQRVLWVTLQERFQKERKKPRWETYLPALIT